mmetsp:Transcript_14432/g.43739  ORF Transcript_14432/g.43739 Transcript_14432/m.43739 type:complete len:258 (-) Transcript_14432:501-1274(-)
MRLSPKALWCLAAPMMRWTSALSVSRPLLARSMPRRVRVTPPHAPRSSSLWWSSSLLSRLLPSLHASAAVEQEVDPGMIAGLEIVKYPHPALRAKSEELREDEFGEAAQIAKRMLALMYEANGVGLAAPQVGINKRLMVFNPEGRREKWLEESILINPRIVATSAKTDVDAEGCLSFPGLQGDVERHRWIKVEALTTKGKPMKKKYEGFLARIFQHEYDHLEGVVYVDRLSDDERSDLQPELDDLVNAYAGPGPKAL